ncbi:hypothetical protein CDAR_57201 [Caerostris darwini]|uniref:Uncharacterized protein n=1 Tax=Caerostris darwini TaxID=1538125 RepID=A0AAV4MN76_9ARAC|nr:hypothetical protein CDAR_57201 [Caerostris darwini]
MPIDTVNTTSEPSTYATIVTDTSSDTNTTSTYAITKKNNRFEQKIFSEKTKDLCHETQHLRLGGTCLMIMSKRIITLGFFKITPFGCALRLAVFSKFKNSPPASPVRFPNLLRMPPPSPIRRATYATDNTTSTYVNYSSCLSGSGPKCCSSHVDPVQTDMLMPINLFTLLGRDVPV